MADLAPHLRLLQERMPAEAGVLLESVTGRDVARAMAEQPAQVAHLLLERRRRRIRIVLGVEDQRVPALCADVLVTPVSIGKRLVVVLAKEARQRVTNARQRPVLRQVFGSAPAPPDAAARLFEDMVVDVMAPQSTRQFG
jgi:hypothetical protein